MGCGEDVFIIVYVCTNSAEREHRGMDEAIVLSGIPPVILGKKIGTVREKVAIKINRQIQKVYMDEGSAFVDMTLWLSFVGKEDDLTRLPAKTKDPVGKWTRKSLAYIKSNNS